MTIEEPIKGSVNRIARDILISSLYVPLHPNYPPTNNNPSISHGQLWGKYLIGNNVLIPNCRFVYYCACENTAIEIVQNNKTGSVTTPNGIVQQDQAYFVIYPLADPSITDNSSGASQNVVTELIVLHVGLYRTDYAQAIARDNTRKLLAFFREIQQQYVDKIDQKNVGFHKNWLSIKDVEIYESLVVVHAVLPWALSVPCF